MPPKSRDVIIRMSVQDMATKAIQSLTNQIKTLQGTSASTAMGGGTSGGGSKGKGSGGTGKTQSDTNDEGYLARKLRRMNSSYEMEKRLDANYVKSINTARNKFEKDENIRLAGEEKAFEALEKNKLKLKAQADAAWDKIEKDRLNKKLQYGKIEEKSTKQILDFEKKSLKDATDYGNKIDKERSQRKIKSHEEDMAWTNKSIQAALKQKQQESAAWKQIENERAKTLSNRGKIEEKASKQMLAEETRTLKEASDYGDKIDKERLQRKKRTEAELIAQQKRNAARMTYLPLGSKAGQSALTQSRESQAAISGIDVKASSIINTLGAASLQNNKAINTRLLTERNKLNANLTQMDQKAADKVNAVWKKSSENIVKSQKAIESDTIKSQKIIEKAKESSANKIAEATRSYQKKLLDIERQYAKNSIGTAEDKKNAKILMEAQITTATKELQRKRVAAEKQFNDTANAAVMRSMDIRAKENAKINSEIQKVNEASAKGIADTQTRSAQQQAKEHSALLESITSKTLLAWNVIKGAVSIATGAFAAYLSVLKELYQTVVTVSKYIGVPAVAAFSAYTYAIVKNTEEFTKFQISLEGALKSTTQAQALAEFAQTLAIKTPVQFEQIQDIIKSFALIPATRFKLAGDVKEATRNVKEFTDVILGLAAIDPVQGVPGALFATREALAGNFRSLALRFEILPKVIAQSIGSTLDNLRGDPELTLKALKTFTSLFVGPDTLRRLGEMPGVLVANIFEAINKAYLKIGQSGVFDLYIKELKKVSDNISSYFDKEFGADGGMAHKFAVVTSSLMKRLWSSVQAGTGTLADMILGKNDEPLIKRFVQGILNMLDAVEVKLGAIQKFFVDNRAMLSETWNATKMFGKGVMGTVQGYARSAVNYASGLYGVEKDQGLVKQLIMTYLSAVKIAGNAIFNIAQAFLKLTPIVEGLGRLLEDLTGWYFLNKEQKLMRERERLTTQPSGSSSLLFGGIGVLQQQRVKQIDAELAKIRASGGGDKTIALATNLTELQTQFNSLMDQFLTQTSNVIDAVDNAKPDESMRAESELEARVALLKPKVKDVFGYARSLSIASDALSAINMQAMEFADALSSGTFDTNSVEMMKLQETYTNTLPKQIDEMNKSMIQTAESLIKNASAITSDSQAGAKVMENILDEQLSQLKDLYNEKAPEDVIKAQEKFISHVQYSMTMVILGQTQKFIDYWKATGTATEELMKTMQVSAKDQSTLLDKLSADYNQLQGVNSDALATEGEKFAAFIKNQISILNFQEGLIGDQNQRLAQLAQLGRMDIFGQIAKVSTLGPFQQMMESLAGQFGVGRTGYENVGTISQTGFSQTSKAIANARAYVQTKGLEEVNRFAASFIELIDSIKDIPIDEYQRKAGSLIRSLEAEAITKFVPGSQDLINTLKTIDVKDTASLRQGVTSIQKTMVDGVIKFLDQLSVAVNQSLQANSYAFQLQAAESIGNIGSSALSGATTLSERAQLDTYGRNNVNRLMNNPFAFHESGLTTGQMRERVVDYYRTLDANVSRALESERAQARATITDSAELARKLQEIDSAAYDLSMTLEDDLANALRNLPLDNVTRSIIDFSDQAGSAIKSGISDSLVSAMNGFSDLGDVGVAVLRNLQKAVADLATQIAFGDINNLGSILAGRSPANFGLFGGALTGLLGFADGGIVNRPTLGLIGEGRHSEAVVPMPGGRIPLTVTNGNVYVAMPGRNVPTSITPMADGFIAGGVSGRTATVNKDRTPVNVVVVSSEEELYRNFPGMVENAVVANIRKRGRIHQAVTATAKR